MEVRLKSQTKEKRKRGWLLWLLGLFLACLWFQKFAIWETGPALEAMAESIKSGEPVGEALETFLESDRD